MNGRLNILAGRLSTGWLTRQPRERALLMLAAGIALLALLWLTVEAADEYQRSSQQQARRSLATLQGMQQQVSMLEPLLARQQRQNSLNWQKEVLPLEVSGRNATQLLFNPGQPDISQLMRWLLQLEREYHVRAVRLMVQQGPQGLTLVQLVLQRHE